MSWWIQIWSWYILSFVRSDGDKKVLNLLKAKENVNVPLDCPAAKKPQQIIAAQPKHSNKPKVHTNTAFPQTGRKQSEKKPNNFSWKKRFHSVSHDKRNNVTQGGKSSPGGESIFNLSPPVKTQKKRHSKKEKYFLSTPPKKHSPEGNFLYHFITDLKT